MECVDVDVDVDVHVDVDVDDDDVVVIASNDGKSLQQETHCAISVSIMISDDRDGIDNTIVSILSFFNVKMTLMNSINIQSL
jgi:hypothetical protein